MAEIKKQKDTVTKDAYLAAAKKLFGGDAGSADWKGVGSQYKEAIQNFAGQSDKTQAGSIGTVGSGAQMGTAADGKETIKPPSFEFQNFNYGGYQESDAVKQAQAMLNQQLSQKPGAYQSQWQSQLNDIMSKILNRDKFSYDMNADALYQQYKDQYTNQGKMAMMDTIGQAAAMTGGYGNSYAQGVGQQAYQGYLQQLNDKVPELYQLALNKYQMEGDALLNQYSMMGAREEQDYGRYRDAVSDWQGERDRLQSQYNTERDLDYSKYSDERNFAYGQHSDERNLAYDNFWNGQNIAYQQGRDQVADEMWQKEFEEAQRQFIMQYGATHYDQIKEYIDSKKKPAAATATGTYNPKPGNPKVNVKEEYLALKKSGAKGSETDKYLKAAVADGLITMDEATELRDTRY